jgi:hypothetical protein
MIKNITQSGAFVQVSSYNPPNIYNTGQSAGEMRYNTNTQHIEVYDGTNWISISQTPTVSLSYEAEEAIRWVRDSMVKEAKLKAKIEKYPTLKSAYEQFKMIEALVYEEEKIGA